MKHISTITIILLLCAGFSAIGQPNSTEFSEIDIRESVRELIIEFGRAVDLYDDTEMLDFEGALNRENVRGYKMFTALFDSVNYSDNIVNFIDPRYINTMIEAQNCKSNQCIGELFDELLKNKNYKSVLSVREYIETYRSIYLKKGISSTILEGAGGSVDSSQIVWTGKVEKRFGSRFATRASAPFSFWAVYLNEQNQQTSINLDRVDLVFDISFDKIKSGKQISYANFKIDKVGDYIHVPVTTSRTYLFSVSPFVGAGGLKVSSNPENNGIDKAFNLGNAWSFETGILLERDLKPFNRNYLVLTLGTGVTFKNININSALANGYYESNAATPPFAPSSGLQSYMLNSELSNSDFSDKNWLVGVPFNIGLGFPLKKDNSLRGFIKTGISYMSGLSSSSEAKGIVDYSGTYIYNNSGTITEITMAGEETPFPKAYGTKDAFTNSSPEIKNGFEVKSLLGVTIPLKGNRQFNIGGYFTTGSLTMKNSPLNSLMEPAGLVHSPLESMDKLKYLGYGLNCSVTFGLDKLKPQNK